MRPEDNRVDDYRGHGSDKDGSGRNILRVAHQWVKLRRRGVGQEFQSSVESLGCPDNGNSENDPTPISRGDLKEESRQKHKGGSSDMNPRAVLTTNHPQKAGNRMAEAADAARELKRRPLFGTLRCGVFQQNRPEGSKVKKLRPRVPLLKRQSCKAPSLCLTTPTPNVAAEEARM